MRRKTSSRRRAVSDSSILGASLSLMVAIMPASNEDRFDEWKELLARMGYAMMLWAMVEESLFKLFSNLLRSPSLEIDSAVFYSSPSFESKKVLTDRVAKLALNSDGQAKWSALFKRLGDQGCLVL